MVVFGCVSTGGKGGGGAVRKEEWGQLQRTVTAITTHHCTHAPPASTIRSAHEREAPKDALTGARAERAESSPALIGQSFWEGEQE